MKTKIYRNIPLRRSRKGLCLVEVLMSLAIMAILLTATAVAFDAALENYTVNHNLAAVSVAARNALYQMSYIIRTAWNDPATDVITVNTAGTTCSLVDTYGRNVVYTYDAGAHQLKVSVDGGTTHHVMVDNVYPVTVGEKIFRASDPPTGTTFTSGTVGRVEIRFMISQEGVTRTFSQAAVPRNVLYGL
jgi:prepilin-type N-terminal cleavage/methylation domain-containing protein